VLADLACAIADDAQVISDFRVLGDQGELFGLVASVPTAWRTLKEIASWRKRADRRITRSPPPGNAPTHIRKPLTCTNPSPAVQE
jgi:hypothetical protein